MARLGRERSFAIAVCLFLCGAVWVGVGLVPPPDYHTLEAHSGRPSRLWVDRGGFKIELAGAADPVVLVVSRAKEFRSRSSRISRGDALDALASPLLGDSWQVWELHREGALYISFAEFREASRQLKARRRIGGFVLCVAGLAVGIFAWRQNEVLPNKPLQQTSSL